MKIIDRGVVFCGEGDTDYQSRIFPGICILPSGRWICTCRVAPTKNAVTGQDVLLTWSDNEGKSWSKPFRPFIPPAINDKPGLFRAAYLTPMEGQKVLATLGWIDYSNPDLPYFNEETEGLLDSRIFFAYSEDSGTTWLEPKLMDTSPFNMSTPITGSVLCLSNGDLACQFELNKHYYDTTVWRHSSVLMFSKDKGQSWPEHVITSNDPENRIFYWDQRLEVLRNDKLLDLFWTYDNHETVYLNIHARESLDNGRTWSDIWDTGVPGQPARPVSLLDGRVAMVYVDRTSAPVIKIRLSSDKGRTWPDKTESIIYKSKIISQTEDKKSMQDTWAEMGKFSVGLPEPAILQNGDILVVYYAGFDTDHTNIEWARVRIK